MVRLTDGHLGPVIPYRTDWSMGRLAARAARASAVCQMDLTQDEKYLPAAAAGGAAAAGAVRVAGVDEGLSLAL